MSARQEAGLLEFGNVSLVALFGHDARDTAAFEHVIGLTRRAHDRNIISVEEATAADKGARVRVCLQLSGGALRRHRNKVPSWRLRDAMVLEAKKQLACAPHGRGPCQIFDQ